MIFVARLNFQKKIRQPNQNFYLAFVDRKKGFYAVNRQLARSAEARLSPEFFAIHKKVTVNDVISLTIYMHS